MRDTGFGELVRRARGGDNVAFDKLYRECESRLLPFVKQFAPSWMNAAEICHDAITRTWQQLERLKHDGAFIAYTHRAAKNLVRKRIEEAARQIRLDDIPEGTACDPALRNLECDELLQAAVGALDAEDRPVFWVAYIDELTGAEGAEALGIPSGCPFAPPLV